MKDFQLQRYSFKSNLNLFLNWRVLRYAFLFVIISIPLSSLSIFSYRSELFLLTARLLQLILFLLLGIIHSDLLEKRLLFTNLSVREKCYYSFVLTLFIYGALLLFYFIAGTNMQYMALAAGCAFLLPYMMVRSWNYYLEIPENTSSRVWNGYKKIDKNPEIVYLNTILINLRLSRKSRLNEETSFLINTPLNLELGNLFNSFLNVEKKIDNIEIECIGNNNKPYGWKFFVISFGGLYKRILDPEKSLQNNGNIKRNTTILAKRVNVS